MLLQTSTGLLAVPASTCLYVGLKHFTCRHVPFGSALRHLMKICDLVLVNAWVSALFMMKRLHRFVLHGHSLRRCAAAVLACVTAGIFGQVPAEVTSQQAHSRHASLSLPHSSAQAW